MSEHTNQHFDAIARRLCAWLIANGIAPPDVPRSATISVADSQLTYERFVRGPKGRGVQRDPADPDRVLTEHVTVPLLVEPSPDVAEWLRPKCPTCGR